MKVETIAPHNVEALARLFVELWEDCDFEKELVYCKNMLHDTRKMCYLVKHDEQYIAFAYLSLRSEYVEGTASSPVVYLEGIYVQPAYQQQGIGRQLVALGAAWGKEMGCSEYASDTDTLNEQSIQFHKQLGFQEVERVVCFVKRIE